MHKCRQPQLPPKCRHANSTANLFMNEYHILLIVSTANLLMNEYRIFSLINTEKSKNEILFLQYSFDEPFWFYFKYSTLIFTVGTILL